MNYGHLKPGCPFYSLFSQGRVPLRSLEPIKPENGPLCYLLDGLYLTVGQIQALAARLREIWPELDSDDAAIDVIREGLPLQVTYFEGLSQGGVTLPNLGQVAIDLASMPAIPVEISAFDAYVLVSLIQAALKHPALEGDTQSLVPVAGRHIAKTLQAYLAELSPVTGESLEMGWREDPSAERDQEEIHVAYTLYELQEDGSPAEKKLVSLSRPQDWGDANRWCYNRCTILMDLGEVLYSRHCHVWTEVPRSISDTFAALGSILWLVVRPGSPRQLCGRDCLDEGDFWHPEWGPTPPMWREPEVEDWDDPVVLYDPEAGSITDSQLREVCERAAQKGGALDEL